MPPSLPRSFSLSTLLWFLITNGLFAILGLVGLGAVVNGFSALAGGDSEIGARLIAIAVGSLLLAAGGGFFYLAHVRTPRLEAARRRQEARYPDQPWMLREEWASRQVVDRSGLAVVIFMLVWCAGWWGAISLIWLVNRDKIIAAFHQSWGDTAAVGFILLCGVAGLMVLLGAVRTWWTYGHATLRIDTLPGYLGDTFRGQVAVRLPAKPGGPIDVTLVCENVRQLTRRSGGKRVTKTTYDERWSESVVVEPGRLLTAREGATSIPIEIAIPTSQPECELDEEGNGIRWVLRVHSLMEGRPALSFQFEVPVYRRR